MQAQPLVSVLMPVYNGEKFLRPALESILAQTFTDFEFIIINDGSTDSSEEIILSYSDPRIRYVKNEQNLKLIATLNKGLDLCRGKYIARMDADDISFPHRLKVQVEWMEQHPEIGLCGSRVEVDPPHKNWVQIGDEDYIRFCFLFHNPFCHPTTMFRTSIIREHKLYYPASYVHAEEYIFWMHILEHSGCYNFDEKLLYYRYHDQQISSAFRKAQVAVGERIRLELLDKIALFTTARMRQAHLVIADVASRELLRGHLKDATFEFGGWVSQFQLRTWLFSMRLSLFLKPKTRTTYVQLFVDKVAQAAKLKRKKEGGYLSRLLSRA